MKPVYCDHRAVCLSNPFTPLKRLISVPMNVFFNCPFRRCVCVCQQSSFVRGLFTQLRSHVISRGAAGPFIHCWMSVSTGCSPWWKKGKRKNTPRKSCKMMNSGARGELIDIWGEVLPSDGREEAGPPVWADVTPALPLQQEGKPPRSWNGLTLVRARNAGQISIWLTFWINNNNYNHNNNNNNKSV